MGMGAWQCYSTRVNQPPKGHTARDNRTALTHLTAASPTPDAAALSVDTWNSRMASATCSSVALLDRVILARASLSRTRASN